MIRALVFAAACAKQHYVKPPQQLLDDAKTMPHKDACKMLTEALASGDYSSQHGVSDLGQATNVEFQLHRAREYNCRESERLGPDSNR